MSKSTEVFLSNYHVLVSLYLLLCPAIVIVLGFTQEQLTATHLVPLLTQFGFSCHCLRSQASRVIVILLDFSIKKTGSFLELSSFNTASQCHLFLFDVLIILYLSAFVKGKLKNKLSFFDLFLASFQQLLGICRGCRSSQFASLKPCRLYYLAIAFAGVLQCKLYLLCFS